MSLISLVVLKIRYCAGYGFNYGGAVLMHCSCFAIEFSNAIQI